MTQTELTPTTSQTGKWKPYPAYKDSGVKWLGQVPRHWDLAPLYSRYSIQLGKMRNQDNISGLALASYLRNVNIQWDHVDISDILEMDFDPAERRKYALSYGDLLVCEGGEVGRTAIWRGELAECYIQNAVHRVRPLTPKEEGRFLFYALYAEAKLGVFKAEVNRSTIGHLTSEKLKKYRFMFPPLREQRAITTFLDHETARINTLIAKKERLIELLQEKRAALISHAVTKGLDPTVPMKDSGVEWLGEIPAHWEACQFKRVADISYGLTLELDRTETKGTPIISLPNVTKEGQLLLDDVPLTPLTSAEKKDLLLRKGDLLFNWRNGSPDHVGKTAYFNADGEYTNVSFLLRIRFDPTKYDSRYYQMFLNNLRNTEFFSSAKNRVNKTYNQTELGRLEVMVPPFEEQRMIASYLDSQTAKINALISRIRDGIEKLKEYSTALISAAVTGKIDVRGEITPSDDTAL